jgi:sugar fermentation stimulation protein A
MKFPTPLLEGVLIRRYQRFLADVRWPDGSTVTAHTANTGSMLGCCAPGSRVWLRHSGNAERKYPWTWELVEACPEVLVGIHTSVANTLVQEAIECGVITQLQGYAKIRREVRYGEENSRIDLLLEAEQRPPCYVEVKNVTLVEDGIARFPDAVTARGTRHLRELTAMVKQGRRGVLVFCIQRQDARAFAPADHIDAVYGKTLREAVDQGVEALAYEAEVSILEIRLQRSLPVILS